MTYSEQIDDILRTDDRIFCLRFAVESEANFASACTVFHQLYRYEYGDTRPCVNTTYVRTVVAAEGTAVLIFSIVAVAPTYEYG